MMIQCLYRGFVRLRPAASLGLLFYSVVTVAAALGSLSIVSVPFRSLSHSTWAPEMAINFDISWLAESWSEIGWRAVVPLLITLMGCVLMIVAAYIFLLGGTLELLSTHQRFRMSSFFGSCGRHFAPLARLAFCTAVCLVLMGGLGGSLCFIIVRELQMQLYDGAVGTQWEIAIVFVFCVCLIGQVTFQYAAIRLVTDGSTTARRALFAAVCFIWRYPFKTIGLYFTFWITAVAGAVVYTSLSQVVEQSSLLTVLLWFLVRQLVIIVKVFLRLWAYASEVSMYELLRVSALPAIT